MKQGIYDMGVFVRGDTIPEQTFALTQTVDETTTPIDLTGVDIKCDFVNSSYRKSLTIGEGITVTDAENGEFSIDELTFDYVGRWTYDIEFTFTDETVKTYITGSIKIIGDITL